MNATETPTTSAITFKDVCKTYPGSEKPALDSLNLDIKAGELVCLVGPSGGGKTTALQLVNRLVELTSGDILIGDQSIMDMQPIELRRKIGYAIQQSGLFPHLTVADNIAVVPKIIGWDKQKIANRVDELLELLGLTPASEWATRYPSQLSGGQQQRVGIARALAADPPVMLMDEPFGALDPITRTSVQNEFLAVQKSLGKTTLFVTHDIDEAIKMSDRIAILKPGGKLAQFATPEEILSNPADDFVAEFLGEERGLKRLSVFSVGDLTKTAGDRLEPGTQNGWPEVSEDSSVRNALSVAASEGARGVTVITSEGKKVASLPVEVLVSPDALARESAEDAQRQERGND